MIQTAVGSSGPKKALLLLFRVEWEEGYETFWIRKVCVYNRCLTHCLRPRNFLGVRRFRVSQHSFDGAGGDFDCS
jgi:hypothetical protein